MSPIRAWLQQMQRFSSGVTGLAAGFKGRKWILPQSTQRASSQREQALNPWKPYRSYSPGIPNNPWSSTSKASSHRPGSPGHSPFPSHSTMCESFYSACDASGQTPLFIFRSMGSHPMGPRHQNFSTFPGHTTSHAREFHGPDSTLNCAGHLKEAPGPSQKPQQPRGPHSTNTSCRDTQSSYWDKLAQQSPSVPPFPAARWDHPKLRLCCGPMARHGGSATAPQGPLGGHMEPMAGALSHMGHSLAFAPRAPQHTQSSSSGSWGWLRRGQQPHRDSIPACLPWNRQDLGLLSITPIVPLPQLPRLADWILHRSCYRSQIVLGPFFGAS